MFADMSPVFMRPHNSAFDAMLYPMCTALSRAVGAELELRTPYTCDIGF